MAGWRKDQLWDRLSIFGSLIGLIVHTKEKKRSEEGKSPGVQRVQIAPLCNYSSFSLSSGEHGRPRCWTDSGSAGVLILPVREAQPPWVQIGAKLHGSWRKRSFVPGITVKLQVMTEKFPPQGHCDRNRCLLLFGGTVQCVVLCCAHPFSM